MNLLPNTGKEALKKGLRLRLLVVASSLLTVSFLIGTVMLLPSYFLTLGNFSKTEIVSSSSKVEDENLTKEILNLPSEIDFKLKFLQSNAANLPVGDIFSKITNSIPEKVILNSISFSRGKDYKEKKGILVLVSGVAVDRNSLVSFSILLKNSEQFSSVDIPVSSLTKDKNLPFSVNIFIENQNE
ncbi:MAG: PilN domain-containing protein [Patescibacteria group bacterium]